MLDELLAVAKTYGVTDINLGGCKWGQDQGFKGAMRRSAHAHRPGYGYTGQICIKSSKVEKLLTPSKRPSELFWHEVGHIYRKSWSQKQCDSWARRMVKSFKA
jgi:hypothetical protein